MNNLLVEDLMIHDWVRCGKLNVQVKGIYNVNKGHNRVLFGSMGFAAEGGYEYIPLTEHIIVSNGFEVDELLDSPSAGARSWCLDIDSDTEIVIRKYSKNPYFRVHRLCSKGDNSSQQCMYVHELQQCLRLWGHKAYANDFSINENLPIT